MAVEFYRSFAISDKKTGIIANIAPPTKPESTLAAYK